MLTHRNFIANCEQLSIMPGYDPRPEDDRTLLVLPLFHIYAIERGHELEELRARGNAGCWSRASRADPLSLEAIQRHRCTVFLGRAADVRGLGQHRRGSGDYDLSSLRLRQLGRGGDGGGSVRRPYRGGDRG